ncbi:ComEA family DNA-binding protein [Arthrobacter crystallopoietes]|uniref:helix-hairpin-helix domain-containing protein n=1 Tax=Crystallibacter crystallopoietes TaxID=37928 RepID=UPI003D192F14
MGRHRWAAASTDSAAAATPEPVRRPRWKIALGAALVAAGLVLGYGIVVVATADLHRAESDVLASVPVASQPAGEGGNGSGAPNAVADDASPPGDGGDTAAPPNAEVPGPSAAAPGAKGLVVHVAGAVKKPGIVRLAAAARVFEALEEAGGALPEADLAALNLAAVVSDGQQIFVPSPQHQPSGGAAAGDPPGTSGGPANADGQPGGGEAGGKVNLNTATIEELTGLPRVGPVLAQRIIDYREQHGAFTRPEDLDAVPGIGEVMLANLIELVTV